MRAARAAGISSSGFGLVLRTVGINKAFHTRIVISSGTQIVHGGRKVSATRNVAAVALMVDARNCELHSCWYPGKAQCPERAVIGH